MRFSAHLIVVAFAFAILAAHSVRADLYLGANSVNQNGPYDPYTTLNGEYTITLTTTQLGPNDWNFAYSIYNVNQSASGHPTGLDFFQIALPTSAVISNIVVPNSYEGGGYWVAEYGASYGLMRFVGMQEQATYPAGTTATFSFNAANVNVGPSDAYLTTYWATATPPNDPYYDVTSLLPAIRNYSGYQAGVLGPVAIPEPSLLMSGVLAAMLLRRGRRPSRVTSVGVVISPVVPVPAT